MEVYETTLGATVRGIVQDLEVERGALRQWLAWSGAVFVCLATVLGCRTKKVVGYAMADHMRASLAYEAIDMAVGGYPVEKGVTIFPLRPGRPVHVSEVPGPPGVLWYPPVRRAHQNVLGQRLGGVLQRQYSRMRGSTE